MKFPAIALSLSSLVVSACGMKLPGGVTLPGGSSSKPAAAPASAASPASAAHASPDAPPSKPVGDLAPYYASLELGALYHLLNDEPRDHIYDQAKAAVGRDPLWQAANPDPTWILAWRQSSWADASENAEAMIQAAFNRAWQTRCVAEAAATRKAHLELAAKHAPELARVDGLANYYERMAGYAALATAFEADATAAGLAMTKDPSGPVGFRVTILAHAIAFHRQSRHAWAAFPWSRFPSAELQRDDLGARELTDDAAFERARYCATVASRGGLTTTPFASIWSEGHASRKYVAWPTVTGDEAANQKRAAQLVAAAHETLVAPPALRVEAIEKLYGASSPAEEPKLARFRDYKVVAVKGGVAKVTRTDTEGYDYACRTTNRLDHFDDNGRAVYQQNCKRGEREYRIDAEVSFDELPPGVTLAAGDVVSFAADIGADAKKQTKATAAREAHVRTMTLTGRQLDEVTRGSTKLTW